MTFKVFISVLICLSVGFVGGFATSEAVVTWYPTLNKPFFNPPNWLFAPVWTILYLMMGVAFALVWDKKNEHTHAKSAMIIFGVQLFLNAIWTPIFFGMKSPILALPVIILMWVAIIVTILKFKPIKSIAAYLLVPYMLWVSFATILNVSIVYLN